MVKEELKITLVQMDIVWENKQKNLDSIQQQLSQVEESDLIVLPEMFTTGFTMEVEKFYETMDGDTIAWMKSCSKEINTAVTGSMIIKEDDKYYNRLVWVSPDGKIQSYDKRHLYTMGGEHIPYTGGNNRLIVSWKGWNICPLICYDLRFPVWSRNNDDYDILLYMANWPSPRHHVWKNLLIARAIENQSYLIGVNRVGTDGMNLNYLGDSTLVDAKGIATFLGEEPQIKTFSLSHSELTNFRKKFPLLPDRDSFSIV